MLWEKQPLLCLEEAGGVATHTGFSHRALGREALEEVTRPWVPGVLRR